MRHLMLLAGLAGCDDTVFPAPEGGAPIAGDGWCGVRSAFAAECVACHAEGGGVGGLDLVTDPHAALVDAPSPRFPGNVLVVPNDPEGSLLFRKITDTQAADEGTPMPPGNVLDDAVIAVFREWIAAGADEVCEGGTGGGG